MKDCRCLTVLRPSVPLFLAFLLSFSAFVRADSVEDTSLLTTAFTNGRSVALGSNVLLVVNDAVHGDELWLTDGTNAGTSLVRDLVLGAGSPGIRNLTAAGGFAYFTIGNGDLWRTDGTAAGTFLVKAGLAAEQLTFVAGTLYFSAGPATSRALWKSNGTTAGTVAVSAGPGNAHGFCALNGVVVFAADTTVTTGTGKKARTTTAGVELWKTDGTSAGTVVVKDIFAGVNGSYPDQLTVLNGAIYFSATTSAQGAELWRTDGTAAGTSLVKDIAPGTSGSYIARLRTRNGKLYFNAAGPTGLALWESDGTNDGTKLATAFAPGVPGFISADFGVVGNRAIMRTDTQNGTELWSSDGTAGGAVFLRLLVDTNPALVEVALDQRVVGNQFFFRAHDYANGTELYVTDGTVANTRLVKDIFPGDNPFMVPLFIAGTPTQLLFAADAGVSDLELWSSDGTPAGTVVVKDFLAD
jgi:ELWxxDGT repeat protein